MQGRMYIKLLLIMREKVYKLYTLPPPSSSSAFLLEDLEGLNI